MLMSWKMTNVALRNYFWMILYWHQKLDLVLPYPGQSLQTKHLDKLLGSLAYMSC